MENMRLATYVMFLIFPTCQGIQWATETPDHAVLYACAQGNLSLPFTLITSSGDVIEGIKWFYSGRSDELIAADINGQFFPTPAYSGRASKSTNAGINLAHVQTLDSGNYSVEVLARTASGDVVILWRSDFVHITDDLQTSDGELHVSLLPVAQYDNQTADYHVVLTCGNFTYPTQPAFQASWMSPSGHSLPSSGYRDNRFYLLVPNPVEDGAYSCHVPSVQACIHGNSSTKASVTVNKLVVMEAKLEAIAIDAKAAAALDAKAATLEAMAATLEANAATLEAKVKHFEETQKRTVSFHARAMNIQYNLAVNSAVQFSTVVTNIGNGYDGSSGKFTAPYNATYFLLAHSINTGVNYGVYMSLVVDATELDNTYTYSSYYYQNGLIQAVVHLTQGQKAWVTVSGDNNYFWGGYTAFSGFLIDHAP